MAAIGRIASCRLTDGSYIPNFAPGLSRSWSCSVPPGMPLDHLRVAGRVPAVIVRVMGGVGTFVVAAPGTELQEGDLIKCGGDAICTFELGGGAPKRLMPGQAVVLGARGGISDGTAAWSRVCGRLTLGVPKRRPSGIELLADNNAPVGIRG